MFKRLSFIAAVLGGAFPIGAASPFPKSDDLELLWVDPVGEETAASDEIDGVGVDNQGRATITGVFRGDLKLGEETFSGRGKGDIFLAQYHRDGSVRWARQFGGSGDDNAFDLALDDAGNIYLSGWFAGSVRFGKHVLKSAGGQDMFLAKLDPDGDVLWARRFGGEQSDGGNEIAISKQGDIAVAALSEGGFRIGGEIYAAAPGSRDSFVLRFDDDGRHLSTVAAAGPGTQRIRAIEWQGENILVGFEYRGLLQFGRHRLAGDAGWDGAAALVEPDGEVRWMTPVKSSGKDNVRGIAPAPGGGAYIAGAIGENGRVADRTYTIQTARGDEYVARLDRSGQVLWIVSGGSSKQDVGAEIRADGASVLVSSIIRGPYKLWRNGTPIASIADQQDSSYLARLRPDGSPSGHQFLAGSGSGGQVRGNTVDVSPDGRYVVQSLAYRGGMRDWPEARSEAHHDAAIALYARNQRGPAPVND